MDLKKFPEGHPDTEMIALGLSGTIIPMRIYTMGTKMHCGGNCGGTNFMLMPPESQEDGPLVAVCADCGRRHSKNQSLSCVGYRLEMWERVAQRAKANGITPKSIGV